MRVTFVGDSRSGVLHVPPKIACVSADQSTFTELAKAAIGVDSMPMLAMPSFLHSTNVVPVPQNGSRTVSEEPTPSLLR